MPADGSHPGIAVSSTAAALIRLAGVAVRSEATTMLWPLDLVIAAGAPTVLLGPNGSGKTTLMKLMMGLSQPTAGRLDVLPRADGTVPRRAFVFQKPVMLRRTAAANVGFALAAAGYAADPATIASLLQRVGLGALADRPARRLSGGEQQRLALARALARKPDILFLDEPTASLDPAQAKMVEDLVRTIAASGVKVVMSTHDLGQARRLAGEIVFLVSGRLVEHATGSAFFTHPATPQARAFVAGDIVI